jgi:two-component sensor histidine kinase
MCPACGVLPRAASRACGRAALRGISNALSCGPAAPLGEHATNGIALVFRELATNAVKHGALVKDAGVVEIAWQVGDGRLALTWRESGGALVAGAPSASGFGTRLVHRLPVSRR